MINKDSENQTSVWKDVVGFEDIFRVSSQGRVHSKRTNKILKTTVLKNGYITISTRIGGRSGKAVCFRVHRLVAEAFIPVPEKLKDYALKTKYGIIPVNHIDGNKLNNNLTNLEWCTYSENSNHYTSSENYSKDHLIGENSAVSKLTNAQRKQIFDMRLEGFKFTKIAKLFNIHRSTAKRVFDNFTK